MRAEDDRQLQSDSHPTSHDDGRGVPPARLSRTVRADSNIVQLRVPGARAPDARHEPRGESPPYRDMASPESVAATSDGGPVLPASTPLSTLVRDIAALEGVVATWDERERNTVLAFERAIDALHKEALSRMIRALKSSPAAAAALRDVASDEVVYAVLRHHGILRASLQERVEAALQSVRPLLDTHGGNVELVEIQPPDAVTIRLLGSCDGCSAAGLTLKEGVERAIKEQCPEIVHVRLASAGLASRPGGADYVSPFAASENSGWVRATRLEEIPDGRVLALVLQGHSLLLSRSGIKVSCFENACAHLGMPLDEGTVSDGVLTCAHHHFQFLLESGECLTVPEVQLQTHAARLVGGHVEVRFA